MTQMGNNLGLLASHNSPAPIFKKLNLNMKTQKRKKKYEKYGPEQFWLINFYL
jgi:hypothetical protein